MTNIRYTDAQRFKALEVFDRTQSATKTVRELGYPGRWTLHRWIRERSEPPAAPIRRTSLKRYPFATKLKAVELFVSGMSPDAVAAELSLNSKMSVYAWAQRFREEGKWGLMSATERKQSAGIVTHKAFEKSLPDDATELKKLAARLSVEKAVLEKELEEIKKDDSIDPTNLSNRFKAIVVDALRSTFPISLLLDIVGLSSSSFYYQLKVLKTPSKYAELTEKITEIVEDSGFSYGYRRVWIQLKNLGIKVSEKVVRRIISAEGLTVRYVKKKRGYSSYRGEISDAPPNLVKRNFHADKPGLLWLTDISEFPADDGKIYFSALVDCFDGKIVGATTSHHPNQKLVDDCLAQAIESDGPADPTKLVIHSDRGCHYRGNSWIQASRDIGFVRSMSKKGCSPDNSACEGLFGRMKNEMFYGRKWRHRDELEHAIHDYVDFYNERRIKLEYGGLSINQRRRNLLL